jgi:hypothetical protein
LIFSRNCSCCELYSKTLQRVIFSRKETFPLHVRSNQCGCHNFPVVPGAIEIFSCKSLTGQRRGGPRSTGRSKHEHRAHADSEPACAARCWRLKNYVDKNGREHSNLQSCPAGCNTPLMYKDTVRSTRMLSSSPEQGVRCKEINLFP